MNFCGPILYKKCSKCFEQKPLELFRNAFDGKFKRRAHCRSCELLYKKDYKIKNTEKIKKYNIEYYKNNIDKELHRAEQYRNKNKEKINLYRLNNKHKIKQHYQNNKNKINEYWKFKYKQNIQYKLGVLLRSRLKKILNKKINACSFAEFLGCSGDFLKQHLESQFQPGMSWDNHGLHGWHIDHIRPLASFDLTDPKQFKEACHYTNLQPLWAKDNLSKGAKYAITIYA